MSTISLSTKAITEDTILKGDKDSIANFMATLINKRIYVSTETDFEKFVNEIKVYKMQNELDVVFVDYIVFKMMAFVESSVPYFCYTIRNC